MYGYLEITFGPMFSGKTNRLIDGVNKYVDKNRQQNRNNRALVINHSMDNRGDGLSPHNKREVKCDVLKTEKLSDVNVEIFDYIAIDEAQFFTDLYTTVSEWLKIGKHIHCSGLVADYNKNVFGQIIQLIPLADDVTHLKAFCYVCGNNVENAPFTVCLDASIENKIHSHSCNKILVGAGEYYRPICGKHHSMFFEK